MMAKIIPERRRHFTVVIAVLTALGGLLVVLGPIARAIDTLAGHPMDDRYVQQAPYQLHLQKDEEEANENEAFRAEMRAGVKDIQDRLTEMNCGKRIKEGCR